MTLGLGLAVGGVVVAGVDRRWGRRRAIVLGLVAMGVVGVAGVLVADLVSWPSGPAAVDRGLLVGAMVWCGPAADVVVRLVLDRTRLPAPEAAAEAGLRAGRWIGRLERWLLVVCVAAGQPTLAVLPIGGKALFRYAEVVADARADAPRLARPDADGPELTRSTLIDYVIVGSLASWIQAVTLGLLVAA